MDPVVHFEMPFEDRVRMVIRVRSCGLTFFVWRITGSLLYP